MSSAKQSAVDTLQHYFRRAWESAGQRWTGEHACEVEVIVDDIVEAAVTEAIEGMTQRVQDALVEAMQPSGAMPWRLQIAATLLGGRFANDASDFDGIDGRNEREESEIALHWADALIAAHKRSDTA